MKITFKQLLKFSQTYTLLTQKRPEVEQTKLGYAMKKFYELNMDKPFKKYNGELDDLRVDNALTDPKTGALLKDAQGGYEFTPAGTKQFRADRDILDEKWDKKEFPIEPYICKEVPTFLTVDEIEVFQGLVIPAFPVSEKIKEGMSETGRVQVGATKKKK